MNFNRQHSEPQIQPYIKKASTAMNFGDAVFVDANGFLDKAGATTTPSDIVGVVQETIASTDSDYATAREIAVDVAEKGDNGDWFLATVGAGTPAQTQVGEAHDLTSAGTVDLTAQSVKPVKIQRIISATLVLVSFTGVPQTAVS